MCRKWSECGKKFTAVVSENPPHTAGGRSRHHSSGSNPAGSLPHEAISRKQAPALFVPGPVWQNGLMPSPAKRMSGGSTPSAGVKYREIVMELYSTLSRTVEPLVTLHPDRVYLFVCGPTVYDYSHLGHARTYVVFDVLVKYLRSTGKEVFYLQNITDVDDKIINRAKEEGISQSELCPEVRDRVPPGHGLPGHRCGQLLCPCHYPHRRDHRPGGAPDCQRGGLRHGYRGLLQSGYLRSQRGTLGPGTGKTRQPSRRCLETQPARFRPLEDRGVRRVHLGFPWAGAARLAYRGYGDLREVLRPAVPTCTAEGWT